MKKNTNLQSLKDANRECKTLSGACKIVAAFWANGYKNAFSQFGVSYNTFKANVPAIMEMCQKNEDGEIYLTKQVRVLDENNQPIKNKDGRTYKKKDVDVFVAVWTPTTLYKVLEQSLNK